MVKRKLNLQQQTKIWYKKLAKTGFVDIEYPGGEIRRTIPASIENKDPLLVQSVQEYYNLASQFLNDYKFQNELERVIWTYHTEGLGVRAIASTLRKARILKRDRTYIWAIVHRLELAMKEMYKVK